MTSTGTAKQVLNDLYAIDADLTPLYGELDDNFLAVTKGGEKCILKIMHVGCDPQRVDLQFRAMAHLENSANELNLPWVIPAIDGNAYTEIDFDGVSRLVWSLKYCPGTLLKNVTHTHELMRSFGRTMALLDLDLRSFSHPAMRQLNKWELTRAATVRPFVKYLGDDVNGQVEAVLRRFEDDILEKLVELPHSVIHNDANDANVLVNVTDSGEEIVNGLIDFGDMSYQPRVCEVAISLSDIVIDKDDPLTPCGSFLGSYNELCELNDDEIALIYYLILTRLAVSVTIAAERHQVDPEDQLGRMDKRPTIRAIGRLAGISRQTAQELFRQACGKSSN